MDENSHWEDHVNRENAARKPDREVIEALRVERDKLKISDDRNFQKWTAAEQRADRHLRNGVLFFDRIAQLVDRNSLLRSKNEFVAAVIDVLDETRRREEEQ